jgi:DNA-binding transcriptional MerR regulator
MIAEKREYMTIGKVVEELKKEFDDISISKIRFYDKEGLITPEKTEGGYRKFYPKDVERIRTILKLQKEKFLPLKVIKSKLAEIDQSPPQLFEELVEKKVEKIYQEEIFEEKLLTSKELEKAAKVNPEVITEMESYGLISSFKTDEGIRYNFTDVKISQVINEFSNFGIYPRHLKMYQNFTNREATFIEQIIMPLIRSHDLEMRKLAVQQIAELEELTLKLRHLLLEKSLKNFLNRTLPHNKKTNAQKFKEEKALGEVEEGSG